LEVREVICIICPRGCRIKVYTSGGEIVKVEGYTCPRGLEYAIQEVKNPRRILMSVVKCRGGDLPVVSVKTDKPIPRDKLLDVSRYLANIVVDAPVNIGDVIVKNVLGLGANIVATRPCRRVERG
jgi:CxxC motif-containing protein